MEERDEIG